MERNDTQTMLLPNQPYLAQLQKNNRKPIFIPKQSTPLVQIHQNNFHRTNMPGQLPLVNIQHNNPKQIIIPNQKPLVQPQPNSIQPATKQNQMPFVQTQQNNIPPANKYSN